MYDDDRIIEEGAIDYTGIEMPDQSLDEYENPTAQNDGIAYEMDEYQKQCQAVLAEMDSDQSSKKEKEGILERRKKKKIRKREEKAERAYIYRHLGYNRPYMVEKIRVYKVVLAIIFIVFALWFATSFFFIDMARYAIRG